MMVWMRRSGLIPLICLALANGCDSTSGSSPPKLMINEVMARNQNFVFTDLNGAHLDWVEIYNPTGTDVPLGGYTLSDNPNRPRKFRFAPNETIPAFGYKVVFLVSDNDLLESTQSGGAEFVMTSLHAEQAASEMAEAACSAENAPADVE